VPTLERYDEPHLGSATLPPTAIVTKVLVENRRLGNPETRVILGIAVIEDIFLAFYLALLQPVLGGADGPSDAAIGIATAFAFLLTLGVIARYGTTFVTRLIGTPDEEIVVVVFVGLAMIVAGIAEYLGVSDAIGAFMVGLILGASANANRLRELTHPLRDAFGAIFFFHFGLTIEPARVLNVISEVLIAVAMTMLLASAAGVAAARIHGFGRVEAGNIGYTVLTRGEFSLILASLAIAAGIDSRVGDLAAGYVLLLAVIGPMLASTTLHSSRLLPSRLFPEPSAAPAPLDLDLDLGAPSLYKLGAELLQVRVAPGSRLHGVSVAELRLPAGSTLGILARDGTTSALKATTQLQTDDVLVSLHPTGPATGRRTTNPRRAPQRPTGRLARRHRRLNPRNRGSAVPEGSHARDG